MVPRKMPDLTAAQWLAVLTWAASQAVAFGWLSGTPNAVALSTGATVLALAWQWADAHLRGRRAAIAVAALDANARVSEAVASTAQLKATAAPYGPGTPPDPASFEPEPGPPQP